MTTLQFPANPVLNQEYDYPPYKYYWDGQKWKTKGIGYNPVNELRDEVLPTTREAIRRSYAEAGFNLVDGSFEKGGTLTSANDVLLHKATGIAYSGPVGQVESGADPTADGSVYVPRNVDVLRKELLGNSGPVIDNISIITSKGKVSALNLATDLEVVGGDNIRDAIRDAIAYGAREIFIPQSENGLKYLFSGGAISPPNHTLLRGQGNMMTQIDVVGDFLAFNDSTYFCGVESLDITGDGTGTAISSSLGLKNFALERLHIAGFNSPLALSNAYQGYMRRLNIENCTLGMQLINAYMTNTDHLIIHNCGKNTVAGRASTHRMWDVSYGANAGIDIGYCQSVGWDGLYMEGVLSTFIRTGTAGSKGVSFNNVDISMLANNSTAFDFDNGQVDTDFVFGPVSIKADGATGCTGFKFGSAADSRFNFLVKPEFLTVNSGAFANEFIYGSAYLDFNYGDSIQRIRAGNVVTGEYKFLSGATANSPSFRRRDNSANYQSDAFEIASGGYYDIGVTASNVYGFVEVLTQNGVVVYYVDGRTVGSEVVSIVHDPSGIGALTNVTPSATAKYPLIVSGGVFKLRNSHNVAHLICVRPVKLISGVQ